MSSSREKQQVRAQITGPSPPSCSLLHHWPKEKPAAVLWGHSEAHKEAPVCRHQGIQQPA